MKHTSLYETHKGAGATMVPFAGWDMPVSYAGTVSEVSAVRQSAGIFDVSHMGEVRVTGSGAAEFVQYLASNNIKKLSPGSAQYSLLLNPQGGIIDDIIVYCVAEDNFLIVLNAGCKDKDWDWIQKQAAGQSNITLSDESDKTALLAIQGPEAVVKVAALASGSVLEITRFRFEEQTIAGHKCILSRTGYTGEDGFEIFCAWKDAPALWAKLVETGVKPAGLGARDVLRLEAAYPLYGHELNDQWSPLESGVGWAVRLSKGDFIGRNAVLKVKEMGARARLVGVHMTERAIPRENYPVYDQGGERQIGIVTSGTFSPTVQAGVAMAHIETEFAIEETPIAVDIRGRRAAGKIVQLPFYRNGV